jgi:hypothetical protein
MFRRVPITTAVLGAIVLAGCSEAVSVSRAPLRADAMKSLEAMKAPRPRDARSKEEP